MGVGSGFSMQASKFFCNKNQRRRPRYSEKPPLFGLCHESYFAIIDGVDGL